MTNSSQQLSTHRDFVMPGMVAEQSRAWLALPEDERQVADPKPSATVMLLREAQQAPSIEVFVLQRAATMAFAPGLYAFPGGGVDPRDADPDVPWTGPSPQVWADRLQTGIDEARELVIAAAREVFEECGVLLAGPSAHEVVADLTAPEWDDERDRLLDRSQSFGELLTRRQLVLRTDLLALRAHWITPTAEPRRYDTRFFAARMPHGQIADDRSSEAMIARWALPTEVLDSQNEENVLMLPPTQVMLEQLAQVVANQLDDWLKTPVPVHPILGWPTYHDGRLVMRSPIGPDGHGLPPTE